RLLVRVHVQRQRVLRGVTAELDEPLPRAGAHGVGGDADADAFRPQRLELSEILGDGALPKALDAAARVCHVEDDELDAGLDGGVGGGPRLAETEVVELADGGVAGGAHLREDGPIVGPDPGGELEHGLAPRPEVSALAPSTKRPLEGVAVRVDEAGDLEIVRHARENTRACVASSRGVS